MFWTLSLVELASILFRSFSGIFSCCFIYDMFLCLLILIASLFFSMYYEDLLCFPALARWAYVISVLCGPVVQSPWSLVLGALSMFLMWRCVFSCCSQTWLLLACQWVGLAFWLTGCKDWPRPKCMSYCVELQQWDSPQQSCVPIETTLWVCCL